LRSGLTWTPLVVLAGMCAAWASDAIVNLRLPPTPIFSPPKSGVLFADDFSDGLRGWVPDRDSVWSVRSGSLRAELPDARQLRSFIYAGSASWTDYAVDMDLIGIRGVDKGVVVRIEDESGIGVDLRGPGYQDVLLHRREWPLGRANVENANGAWHHLRVEAREHRYRVWVDGALVLDRADPRKARPRGRIALHAYPRGAPQSTVYYDNVIVTALKHIAVE